jgi:hypothetical protein
MGAKSGESDGVARRNSCSEFKFRVVVFNLRSFSGLLMVSRTLRLKLFLSFLELLAKLFQSLVAELAGFLEELLLLLVGVMFDNLP